jgi:hypothetical protein
MNQMYHNRIEIALSINLPYSGRTVALAEAYMALRLVGAVKSNQELPL